MARGRMCVHLQALFYGLPAALFTIVMHGACPPKTRIHELGIRVSPLSANQRAAAGNMFAIEYGERDILW